MFTGIIEATAQILEVSGNGLTIARPPFFNDLKLGSSVCVSGVCLSVVALTGESIHFDVVPETRERTTLGHRNVGESVNLERSLRADGRFEGHVVQGHIEGVGVVWAVEKERGEIEIEIPTPLLPCMVEKGSVALDGISLTIAKLKGDRITIALIPHTLEHTTFSSLKVGDGVNVETDILLRGLRHQAGQK